MAARNQYESYYLNQAGSGVSHIYAGGRFQRGHGVGSFLKGVFRGLIPFLTAAGRAVAGEAAEAGANILSDVASGSAPLGESVKRHAHTAGERLQASMKRKASQLRGAGYKKRKIARRPQSRRGGRAVRTPPAIRKADVLGYIRK